MIRTHGAPITVIPATIALASPPPSRECPAPPESGKRSARWIATIALLLACLAEPSFAQQTLDFIFVGDAGNAADSTGYGAVGSAFEIGRFEFTNAQYVQFLNAVDPDGTNPNAIYNASMGSDARGGIGFTAGNSSGTKYAPRTNMADKPVNFVNWFDAARVANWLENGGQTYGTTASGSSAINGGAYTLGGAVNGTAPAPNPGAGFRLPTENEWYKAAYSKGGGTNAGYWSFATQSDSAPAAVAATIVGTGTLSAVSPVTTGNSANYLRAADWNGQDGNGTAVGSNGGPSAAGTFDMGGNVWEWNDLTAAASSSRGIRGGSWNSNSSDGISAAGASSHQSLTPALEANDVGFRLAGALPTALTWNATDGIWNATARNWVASTIAIYAMPSGASATFSSTSGGTVTLSGSMQPSAVIVSASSGTYTFVSSAGNLITGTAALSKSGAGTLVLSGNNAYSGGTTLSAGTLVVNGTLANSAVTVQSGATLSGNAFLGSSLTVLASGTLSPGNSPGTITAGTLTLQEGSTTRMEIAGSATAGTDYDTLVVTGSNGLTYGGTLALTFSNASTFADGTTFDLFRFSGTSAGSFSAVTLSAAGGSPYANLSFSLAPDGSWYSGDTAAHQYLRFTPLTGDLVVVPEPSTWIAALAGIAMAARMVRSRRARS